MRYATVFTVPNEIHDDKEAFIRLAKHNHNYFKRKQLQKSIRVMNSKVELFEQDADNFLHNRTTVRIKYDGYKIPRIIKNRLSV